MNLLKSENKNIRLIMTMFFTGMAFVINFLISLFLVPYISENMCTDAYGFVSLAINFVNYAAIFTTALNAYASRFITVEYHKGNMDNARRYFSSVFYGDVILSVVIITVLGVVTFYLERFLDIPDNLVTDVKALFIIIFINFFFLTVSTAYGSFAQIRNHLDFIGIFKGAGSIAQVISMVVLFCIFGANLWVIGVGYLCSGVVMFVSNYFLTKKYTPELRADRKHFSLSAIKELVINGIWNSVSNLGNTLNTGLDLLITNIMLGSFQMGQLSYAKTIGTIFATLFNIIAFPFQPLFLKYYSDDNREALIKEFRFSMKIAGAVSELAFAGFLALGYYYIGLWIPGEDTKLVYLLTILTISTCIGEGVVSPLYYAYTLTIKNRIPCLITVAGGLLNVAGMYVLIKYAGMQVMAVVLTTVVISTLTNVIFHPMYAAKCLGVRLTTFLPDVIKHIFLCGLLTGVFALLNLVVVPGSWVSFAGAVLLYGVAGGGILFMLIFNRQEKKKLFGFVFGKGGSKA